MQLVRSQTQHPDRRRLLVRSVWVALFLLALGFYGALVPITLASSGAAWNVATGYRAVSTVVSLPLYTAYATLLRYTTLLVFLGTALLLFWRRADDGMALFSSIVLLALPASFDLAGSGYDAPWGLYYRQPWPTLWEMVYHLLSPLGMMGLFGLFFLFPDGRIVPQGLRRPVIVLFALLLALGWLTESFSETLWAAFFGLFLFALLLAAASQIYRYRRVSTETERQQTKLVVLGIAVVGILWPLFFLVSELFFRREYEAYFALASLHLQLVTLALLPLSITVSMLRYRLWDVDRLINRTIVYGSLTVLVFVLYALIVGGTSALLHTRAGLLAAVILTGVVALLAQPLREMLQRTVNRLLYGERDDPITALTRLGEQLERTAPPHAIYSAIATSVQRAIRTPYVAVATVSHSPGAVEVVAEAGVAQVDLVTWPLVHQGLQVGELRVAPRAPGERFSSSDARLLATLAHQAGAAVHAAQLSQRLQRSRERLVVTREEDRRRLQRDLHDGLGPQLASLTLKLEAARNLLDTYPEEARILLDEGKQQAQQAIADVRDLVYELYPLILEQMGLLAALRQVAASYEGAGRLRLDTDLPERLPPLPAAVAAAAYLIAREALTNVVRHADAQAGRLRLTLDGDALLLEIADDGRGVDARSHTGVGLSSMREHAEELGGWFRVNSPSGGGTVVQARLPL